MVSFHSELVNLEEEKIKTDPVKKEKFFKSINKAFKRHAMISASIEVTFETQGNIVLGNIN